MKITNSEEYEDFFYRADTKGISFADFREAYEYDDNVAWRLDHGHLANLLEEALARLGAAYSTGWEDD